MSGVGLSTVVSQIQVQDKVCRTVSEVYSTCQSDTLWCSLGLSVAYNGIVNAHSRQLRLVEESVCIKQSKSRVLQYLQPRRGCECTQGTALHVISWTRIWLTTVLTLMISKFLLTLCELTIYFFSLIINEPCLLPSYRTFCYFYYAYPIDLSE